MNYVGNAPAPVQVADPNPIGMIAWFHAPPDGSWLHLNGQSVSKTAYPDLWIWAQSFLTADQTTNPGLYRSVDANLFAVPKMDGLFIRAQGQVDASHVAAALGVKQADQNVSHVHAGNGGNFVIFGGAGDSFGSVAVGAGHTPNTAASGGAEARPINVALVPCVKALRYFIPLPLAGVTAASQAEMEAAVATDRYVSPAVQKYHPGMAKAWVLFTGSTAVIRASYNVSGVVRNSVGNYTATLTVPFSSVNYCVIGSQSGGIVDGGPTTVSTFTVRAYNDTGASGDPTSVSVACFGDQ